MTFVFSSWLTSLCITGSRFIHLSLNELRLFWLVLKQYQRFPLYRAYGVWTTDVSPLYSVDHCICRFPLYGCPGGCKGLEHPWTLVTAGEGFLDPVPQGHRGEGTGPSQDCCCSPCLGRCLSTAAPLLTCLGPQFLCQAFLTMMSESTASPNSHAVFSSRAIGLLYFGF